MSDNLKDIFKQHVDYHESPVDPNEIWEGIVKKRQEPKRRRILFFLPFVGLLLIAGLLYMNGLQSIDNHTTDSLTHNSAEIISSTQESIQAKPEVLIAKETETPTKEKSKINSVSTGFNTLTTLSKTNEETTTNSQTERKTSTTSTTLRTNNTSNEFVAISSKSTIIEKSELIKREIQSLIPEASLLNLRINSYHQPVELNRKIIPLQKKKRRPSISLEFAAAMLSKSLHSVDAALLSLADDKQSYEKPIDSYSTRISFNLPVINNFSVNLGLGYTRMYEKFDWSGTYMRNEFGDILPIESYDSEGTPLFNYTTGIYFEEVNNNISYFNKYEIFDLPISFSYDIQTFNKLDLRFTAGYSLILNDKFEGYLFTEQNVPTKLENLNNNPSFSSSPFAQVNLSYPIFNNTTVNCGIDFRYRRMAERTTAWNYRSLGAFLGLSIGI